MSYTRNIAFICILALIAAPTVPACVPGTMDGALYELSAREPFSGIIGGDRFLPNHGQVADERVLFHTSNAYFTSSGIVFRVLGQQFDSTREMRGPWAGDADGCRAFHIYSVEFEGANDIAPEAVDVASECSNYILGNDGSRWVSGVPSFNGLRYENLYDGIDLAFRAVPDGLKYEFTVRPGADLSDIVMRYSGASLSTDGLTLVIGTSVGDVNDGGLVSFQEGKQVPCRMVLTADRISFEASYDSHKTLIVDPLVYSTFLGGTGLDHARGIALDPGNNAYVCGFTDSLDFPTTPGAYDTSSNGGLYDAFVTKLNASGNGTVFSTYIGGAQEDRAYAIHVDSTNVSYVAGYTNSSDFPTTVGAFDTTYNGVVSYDPFVLKLNAAGSALSYSTYLGGSYADYVYGLDVDSSGCAYVVGYTYATDYPTTAGAWDTTHNGGWYDAFITKLASNGGSLSYSTYLGGSSDDYGYGIALDSNNNAYVTGETYSTNFSVTGGAYSGSNAGGFDAFVTKLNAAGSGLSYSTYLGSTGTDGGYYLTVDGSGQAYVACFAGATGFPTTVGAYDTTFNTGTDVAVVKLNAAGNGLVYSTYIGGSGADYPRWITIDDSNVSYVTGVTDSVNFPSTPGAEDTSFGGGLYDITVFVMNATGANLTYSSYLGGAGDDYGRCIAVDSGHNFYITGQTSSSTYPVTNGAYSTLYSGGGDAFVTKLKLPGKPLSPVNLGGTAGNSFIKVNWSPPNDTGGLQITNYTVYRGLAAGSLSVLTTLGNSFGYNDTGVTNGVVYYYAVSATNALGEGNLSGPINMTAGSVPGTCGGLMLDAGFKYVGVSWSPPFETGGFAISGYSLYRGTDAAEIGRAHV